MKPRIQFITVKGIIQNQGKILLLKDPSGKWDLPGGKIDFGESPEQTLDRELGEELQIKKVSIGNLLHAWTFMVEREDSERQYIVLVYECVVAVEEIQHSDEHVGFGWFTREEIQKLPLRDGYKKAISFSRK